MLVYEGTSKASILANESLHIMHAACVECRPNEADTCTMVALQLAQVKAVDCLAVPHQAAGARADTSLAARRALGSIDFFGL